MGAMTRQRSVLPWSLPVSVLVANHITWETRCSWNFRPRIFYVPCLLLGWLVCSGLFTCEICDNNIYCWIDLWYLWSFVCNKHHGFSEYPIVNKAWLVQSLHSLNLFFIYLPSLYLLFESSVNCWSTGVGCTL